MSKEKAHHMLMYDKVVKKIFKKKKIGRELTARMVSLILHADYETIYNNLRLTSEDIAFDARTINCMKAIVLWWK